ncbi:MAG: WD40 repeat domain-containing protein [bacterium]|nr:WD40 repeat domain-containing protein [bacterium]
MTRLLLVSAPEDQAASIALFQALNQQSITLVTAVADAHALVFLLTENANRSRAVHMTLLTALLGSVPLVTVVVDSVRFGDFLFLLEKPLTPYTTPDETVQKILAALPTDLEKAASATPPPDAHTLIPEDLFFTATERIESAPGEAVFLYRALLDEAPDYARGAAKTYVQQVEARLQPHFIALLQPLIEAAIARRDWTQAEHFLDDMRQLEALAPVAVTAPMSPSIEMPSASLAEQLRTRLIQGRLDELWEKAVPAVEAKDWAAALPFAEAMLGLDPKDARALDVVDQRSRYATCEAIYEQAVAANAAGRIAVVALLVSYIAQTCPGFGDPHGLLRGRPLRATLFRSVQTLHRLLGHTGPVLTVAFSPVGGLLVSGSTDNSLRLWEIPSGREVGVLRRNDGSVRKIAFSRDGAYLASISGGATVRVWMMPEGREVVTFDSVDHDLEALDFMPDGAHLVCGYVNGLLRVVRIEDGAEIQAISAHDYAVHTVAVSPDGSRIASGSGDKRVRLWAAPTLSAAPLKTLEAHEWLVNQVVFSADGMLLASAANDASVYVWQVDDGSLVYQAKHDGQRPVKAAAFSPLESLLATGSSDRLVRLWDVPNRKLLGALEGHSLGVETVAFSPDGLLLASGSADQEIRLWGLG